MRFLLEPALVLLELEPAPTPFEPAFEIGRTNAMKPTVIRRYLDFVSFDSGAAMKPPKHYPADLGKIQSE